MSKKNRVMILVITAASTLLLVVTGFSFAFFLSNISLSSTTTDISTTSLDSLIYNQGNAIDIVADQTNFAKNLGDKNGSTESTVTLTVNNKTAATYCYTADLVISENGFTYSVNNSTPEILISVSKNANGAGYQSIINNMDVTTTSGSIHIPIQSGSNNYKHVISGQPNDVVVDKLKVDFVFVNLDELQNVNTGKVFNSYFELNTVAC